MKCRHAHDKPVKPKKQSKPAEPGSPSSSTHEDVPDEEHIPVFTCKASSLQSGVNFKYQVI